MHRSDYTTINETKSKHLLPGRSVTAGITASDNLWFVEAVVADHRCALTRRVISVRILAGSALATGMRGNPVKK